MSICVIDGCAKVVNARGWCMKHYTRWKRHGSPAWEPPGILTFEQRLARHALITTSCWLWTGARDRGGYGRVNAEGRWWGAHRWVYCSLVSPLPSDAQLDHLCRVPACVNPDHLEPVTPAENIARSSAARKRFCLRGHDLWDERNVHREGNMRRCRPCLALHARARRAGVPLEGVRGHPRAEKTAAQVSQVPPDDSEGSTRGPRGPAIVIRTIEGRAPVPQMTPERHAEQVAKLARAGIHIPDSERTGP